MTNSSSTPATNKIEQIYPPTVWAEGANGEDSTKPYDLYEDAVKNKKVGDKTYASSGGPGFGHIIHEITAINKDGVYGFVVENTMRMGSPEDFI